MKAPLFFWRLDLSFRLQPHFSKKLNGTLVALSACRQIEQGVTVFSSIEPVPLFRINETSEKDANSTEVRFAINEPAKATEVKKAKTGAPTPLRASELMTNAILLKESGEADLAKALFREALNLDSRSQVALKNLFDMIPVSAETLSEREKIATARYAANKDIESTLALAKIKSEKASSEEAQQLYFEAAACESDRSELFFEIYKDIGNLCVRSGDYEGAEEYYFKAHAINGESDILQVNLGTLEVQRDDWGQARERFGQAILFNNKNDKAWVGVAMSHYNLGEYDLANASLTNALDFNPLNRTAVHLLASWSLKTQNYEPAINALQNFLSQVDHDAEMSLALIHLFCETKQYDLALFEVERTLLWDPLQDEVLEIEKALRAQVG